MTTTNEIINVLKSHSDIITVTLESLKDCRDFWGEYKAYVYGQLPASIDGIQDWQISNALDDFRDVDTLEIVNRQGRLLKRFANYCKNSKNMKLTDKLLGILGDALQRFINRQASTYYVDFTNVIDWKDGQFGKEDSCWWGCYKESQEVLINNGGWGIRFYQDDYQDNNNGIGRTWLLPRDGMLIGFNSYGVTRPNTSKVIKAIFNQHGIKLHYKQVSLENSQNDEIPYINGDSGFVLYPDDMNPDSVPDHFDFDMETSSNKGRCNHCNSILHDDYQVIGDYSYCDRCTSNLFSFCDACQEYCDKNDVHHVADSCDSRYEYICRYCANGRGMTLCYECSEYTDETTEDSDGDSFCESCAKKYLSYCESCEVFTHNGRFHDCPTMYDYSGLIESHETHFHAQLRNGSYYSQDYHDTTVYRLPDVLGIALYNPHNLNSDLDNAWTISHDASGLAIKSGLTFTEAKRVFIELSKLTDWNQPADEITSNSELMNRILIITRK